MEQLNNQVRDALIAAGKKVLIVSPNGTRRRWIYPTMIPEGVALGDLMYDDSRLPPLPGKAVKK